MKYPLRGTIIYISSVLLLTCILAPLTMSKDSPDTVGILEVENMEVEYAYSTLDTTQVTGLIVLVGDSMQLYTYLETEVSRSERVEGYVSQLGVHFERYLSLHGDKVQFAIATLMDNIIHYAKGVLLDLDMGLEPTHSLSSLLKSILELKSLSTHLKG